MKLKDRVAIITGVSGGGQAYNCAKAGVAALTQTLVLQGCKKNIRVNAVAPGLVDTKYNVGVMQPKPEDLQRWLKREEIVAAVVFLASDDSCGVNGQIIEVTGRL